MLLNWFHKIEFYEEYVIITYEGSYEELEYDFTNEIHRFILDLMRKIEKLTTFLKEWKNYSIPND